MILGGLAVRDGLEYLVMPSIPLVASPEGAVRKGTIDAKDERRRSDVQNMGAS